MGDVASWVQQADATVRFEWGPAGVAAITASPADVVVIVDVLRFTTAVDAAVSRGAIVFPYRWKDDSASGFATEVGAVLADGLDPHGPSLSPVRLLTLPTGSRVVLPSPNGSTCAAIAAESGATVVAACLRNAEAVARWVDERGGTVAVIPCGERWPDGSLRPSLEDHLAAAWVVSLLRGPRSAEAELAAASYAAVEDRVADLVRSCTSGRELAARGWGDDLDHALDVGASAVVPVLVDGAFTAAPTR